MKKILILLLIAGILASTCTFQVAAEPIHDANADFVGDQPLGDILGDPAPCGEGGGGGSGPIPG